MSSKNVDHGQNQPDDQPPKVFTVDHDSEATPDEESTPVMTPGEELVTHSNELGSILENSPVWNIEQLPTGLYELLTMFNCSNEVKTYFKLHPLKNIKQIVELTLDILESYEGTPTLQDRPFIDFISMVVTLGRFFGNTDPPATAALTTYFCNSFDRDLFNRYCTRNFPSIQKELKDAFSKVLKSSMSSGGVTKVPSSRKNTTTPKLHSEKATQTPVHSNTSPKK